MCRTKEEGGRRCHDHNAFGIKIRNLQAKKQYHAKKGHSEQLSTVVTQMETLRERKTALLEDGGKLHPYTMELTANTEKILNQLQEDGYEPYIVGGSVRDALLNLPSKDIDIEVYKANPEQVVKSLRKIGKVDEVGKSFGVLKITVDGEEFDVSLPRIDSKSGDGHRGFTVEVTPDLSLQEATSRRDYTINALMYDHALGFIVDKHTGLEDMENKQLRHVSDAFDEDPLRVLRGVQMASRFGMDLHPETVTKAQTLADAYSTLAVERVQTEFQKLYSKGKNPAKALKLLHDTGWEKNFHGLPETNTPELAVKVTRTQELINDGTIKPERREMFLAAVISSGMTDKDAERFLAHTTVGSDTKNLALNLRKVKLPETVTDASLKQWAYDMPRLLTVEDWATFTNATGNPETAEKILTRAKELKIDKGIEKDLINGEDVMKLNKDRKPGPWMKEALTQARTAQYENGFTTKEQALQWLKNNVKS